MGRSIGAVALGFLYALAGIGLTQFVLWFCIPGEPQDDDAESVPPARLVLTVACTFASSALGGFMAAHFAGRAQTNHGLALGTILVAVLALTAGLVQADYPPWYRLALPATALPGALLGAYLRSRLRRPPAPAPPKAT